MIDDDTTGVNVSPLELAVLEGTSETCTVALAGKPSAEVHISLNSNNNDVSPSPAFLTFSPTTWATAQEVMVPVAQDEDATDEVATLTFSATSPDPAYHGISVPAVSVDINDDDNAGVKVVPNPHMSVPEGESATYTIVLLSQPLATVAVAISSSNPQMLTAAFDEVTFTQDNWSVAQTVAFDTFHDDNTLDENEVLSHSAVSLDPNYKGISVTPLLVTITDRTAEKLTRTLPVLLSAMSGALAESIQTAVESRFERRRQMQRMKQDQGWWMPSYYQDRSRLSPEFNPSGGPETEPILSRASFGLPLAGNAFDGTHWRPVLWGHGDFQHFNGTSSLVDFPRETERDPRRHGPSFQPARSHRPFLCAKLGRHGLQRRSRGATGSQFQHVSSLPVLAAAPPPQPLGDRGYGTRLGRPQGPPTGARLQFRISDVGRGVALPSDQAGQE